MNELQNIRIIGGGISGLSTALALKKKGIDFDLYERNSEITYENVGLGISANIFPILNEWQILEQTKAIGTEIKNFHFVDKNLNYIKTFEMEKPPLSVNRRLFYELLINQLKDQKIHLNSSKLPTDFHQSDIIISADGINSSSRKKIHPNLELRDSNQVLWRGITKINLDKKFKGSYHDFIGNNLRFAIIHSGKDYYSWYIVKQKGKTENTILDKETLKHFFKDYHPIVLEIIDKSRDIYFAKMQDINPRKRKSLKWFLNNNLMIGDSIHPTTPNLANGACLAIEDSYYLGNLLYENGKSIENIFSEFQKKRTKKIDSVVNQSWWYGKMLHQKNAFFDYLMKNSMRFTPKIMFNAIYSKVLSETDK